MLEQIRNNLKENKAELKKRLSEVRYVGDFFRAVITLILQPTYPDTIQDTCKIVIDENKVKVSNLI
jgi:hypothetical protein